MGSRGLASSTFAVESSESSERTRLVGEIELEESVPQNMTLAP
jgi:hypothetical protein